MIKREIFGAVLDKLDDLEWNVGVYGARAKPEPSTPCVLISDNRFLTEAEEDELNKIEGEEGYIEYLSAADMQNVKADLRQRWFGLSEQVPGVS